MSLFRAAVAVLLLGPPGSAMAQNSVSGAAHVRIPVVQRIVSVATQHAAVHAAVRSNVPYTIVFEWATPETHHVIARVQRHAKPGGRTHRVPAPTGRPLDLTVTLLRRR